MDFHLKSDFQYEHLLHLVFKFFSLLILRQKEIKFVFESPNLSSAFPVEIFLCVGALISGFSLIPIAVFF